MAKTLEKLPEELAAQPPFVAGGRQFQMYFIGVREPKLPTEHHLVVNFGAKNAGGQWLLFLDDDCMPRPSFFSAYWSAIAEAGAAAF